ncbi:hypothetical protein E4U52_003299 [Claviceps spartinae]|nr:hypothetical protein E4U52_003299 [Claviceps spartinae]
MAPGTRVPARGTCHGGPRAGKIIDSGLPTNNYITIGTYADIFSDEPDAGRMILPATTKAMTGGRSPSNESENPVDADDPRISDLGEPQPIDLDSTGSTTGPPATPKPSRKKTSKANKAPNTAGAGANAIANARLRDPESPFKSIKAKLRCLQQKPEFEDVESPGDLDRY